ncbi:AAA family ATPase [Photobacterium aphoticum]|uniref:endopeptidase La n=1 Tax=Photobacterium aphoticum TaxID=754436 RepID=A0A0J1GL50_9GAMM|nr:Lon protease family protein [Photobacterium aphoticum]KLV00490.1 ATP-dependent protease [Photobacterium aphoticum]PSU59842.1 Lon protease family protein [Photobacterium aphoticum]GHA41891.1 ATP-dependent protease [Photobacterium aphoticum]
MHEETWRTMTPDYTEYQAILEQYDDLSPAVTGTLQDRLTDAVRRFTAVELQPRVLRITAPDNKVYRDYVIELIAAHAEHNGETPVIVAGENVSELSLFGAVYPPIEENHITKPQVKHGLVHQAHNGYLVLSVGAILANPSVWPRLKSILMNGSLEWQAASNKTLYPLPPAEQLNIKLVLIGDRFLMGELENAEPDISSGFTMYGEFEQDLMINEDNLPLYMAYLKSIIKKASLPELADIDALTMVLKTGARYAEDQVRVPLCPIWHQSLLCEAAIESHGQPITATHLKDSIAAREYRESYLPERAIEDIHHGQVVINCQGEEVGQVNGLTVVEVPGHPRAYGEPARISCVVHFGDGDISDVERKAELGGNIHAKGMMIMQAFLSTALDLDQPLPFSASIVFEQSYSEVDGDSASLAELCSLVSALAIQPINQQIAVTGAVDQFGRVQAVGGINEKIEGFYKVCAYRGLTGSQGVILPRTNLTNLCLNDEVLEAIKAGQFHLWTVESVDDALPLLTGKVFRSDEEEDNETLLARIADRIDAFHNGPHDNHFGLLSRLRHWFVQN